MGDAETVSCGPSEAAVCEEGLSTERGGCCADELKVGTEFNEFEQFLNFTWKTNLSSSHLVSLGRRCSNWVSPGVVVYRHTRQSAAAQLCNKWDSWEI